MSPSRRERAKAEKIKQEPLKSANGVQVGYKSCQAMHPELDQKCWHGKKHAPNVPHVIVRSKPGGGFDKVYW